MSRSSLSLFNGELASETALGERMFQYADGVFESMRGHGGVIPLWSVHRERLQRSAQALFLNINFNEIEEQLNIALSFWGDTSVRIKLMVGRSGRGRGSYLPDDESCNYFISLDSLPDNYAKENVVELVGASRPLNADSTFVGLKLINRLHYIVASKQAKPGVIDGSRREIMFLDSNNRVVETMHHNIFWQKGESFFTPKLENVGVHGVMRSYVLSLVRRETKFSMIEVDSNLATLVNADAAFITNAIDGIVPVNVIDGHSMKTSPVVKDLQNRVNELFSC